MEFLACSSIFNLKKYTFIKKKLRKSTKGIVIDIYESTERFYESTSSGSGTNLSATGSARSGGQSGGE